MRNRIVQLLLLVVTLSAVGCSTQNSASLANDLQSRSFKTVNIYCWHVTENKTGHGGYAIHDGKTGDVPVWVSKPSTSLQAVALKLRQHGITLVILHPYFPGVLEEGWTVRSLTKDEQARLNKEITIVEIRDP